jgi:hypothetical protein
LYHEIHAQNHLMSLVLPIPTPSSDSLGASVFKLMQLSRLVNKSKENEIILDFSKTSFQFSCFLGGLYILRKGWESKGKKITIKNVNSKMESYLNAIHFPGGYTLAEKVVYLIMMVRRSLH